MGWINRACSWGWVLAAATGACGGKVTSGLDDADANASTRSVSSTGGSGATNDATSAGGPVGGASSSTAANSSTAAGGAPATSSAIISSSAMSSTGGKSEWTNGIPPLHTEGRDIKDPSGNVVVLRGVALADLQDVDTDRQGMSVQSLLGLLTDAEVGFYTRVVRFTVFPERWVADPETYLAKFLLPAVDAAASLGLYAIVDWHEISDVEPVEARTWAFWRTVAPVFANYSNVLYELFNEPVNTDDPSWQRWKEQAQPWVDLIRSEAPDNIILIGGPFYSQQIGGAATDPFEGTNLAYVGHIYPIIDRYVWSDTGVMAQVAAVQPLMITEWGFREEEGQDIWNATRTSFGEPLKAFIETHGLGWTAWCADNLWGPVMFAPDWQLLTGEGEMGGFAKEWLLETKDSDQPQR